MAFGKGFKDAWKGYWRYGRRAAAENAPPSANDGTGWLDALGSRQGRVDSAIAESDLLNFDAMDELEKAMAQYSYSASRGAYAPFFTQAGKRGSGERSHTGYTGPRPSRDGSAPTPGSGNPGNPYSVRAPGQFRGLAQALGASQRRSAKPGSLAPRTT